MTPSDVSELSTQGLLVWILLVFGAVLLTVIAILFNAFHTNVNRFVESVDKRFDAGETRMDSAEDKLQNLSAGFITLKTEHDMIKGGCAHWHKRATDAQEQSA